MFQLKRGPHNDVAPFIVLFIIDSSAHQVVIFEAKDLMPPHEILFDESQ
jgi:hypothetical protein